MSSLPFYRKNENHNRYTKKQEQRRKIDALVGSDILEVSRREPNDTEVEQLLKNIRDNKISEFGLVKLSMLDLNGLHDVGEDGESRTLLRYATARGRDKIAMALLRAGASPYVEGNHVSRACTKDFPAQYVVWLMRYESTKLHSGHQCQECSANGMNCIRFENCSHTVCLSCFWSRLHDLDWLKWKTVEAATNDMVWEGVLDPLVCCLVCGNASNADRACQDNSPQLLCKSSDDCKRSSYALYCQLPCSFSAGNSAPGSSSKGFSKETAHRGLHLSEIARCSLGTTQTQRDEELVKACMKGDLRRVAALVEGGVHVDCVDEYGMTALMQAAWLGHVHVCALLLAAGADVDIKDALGHTAMFIAHSAGHVRVVELLYGAGCSPTDRQHLGEKDEAPYIDMHNAETRDALPSGLLAQFAQSYNVEFRSRMREPATVSVLIPPLASHNAPHVLEFWHEHGVKGAEAGAYCLDNCFESDFLQNMVDVHASLTVAPSEKPHCASRSYFCDVQGRVTDYVERIVRSAGQACLGWSGNKSEQVVRVFPQMRFLHYQHDGTALAPHVDLARRDARDVNIKSTHTMILYLTDCAVGGGETVLLKSLNKNDKGASEQKEGSRERGGVWADENVVASVSPRMGRLLLFPHNCPHEGRPIDHKDPKLLLRGEVFISSSYS